MICRCFSCRIPRLSHRAAGAGAGQRQHRQAGFGAAHPVPLAGAGAGHPQPGHCRACRAQGAAPGAAPGHGAGGHGPGRCGGLRIGRAARGWRARYGPAAAALWRRPAHRRSAGAGGRCLAVGAGAARRRQARQAARRTPSSRWCARRLPIICASVPIPARPMPRCFAAPAASGSSARSSPRTMAPARRRLGLPDSATPHALRQQISPVTCSRPVSTCARSRSCLAMPACPRPESIPMSMPPICSMSTAMPIRAREPGA